MEIRKWQFCIVFNCALIYCGVAKTFSLNEAIAAESQSQPEQTTISAKLEDTPTGRFSNKSIKPLSVLQKKKKVKDSEIITSSTKDISPLKYRKTFQIKSPLKPKRLKYLIGAKQKRNNQAIKREINSNDKLKQKHIPLLKSLSMLLDNILGPDSGESFEAKPKRKRYYFEGSDETCKCATKSSPLSQDETDSVSQPLSSEISVATEASTETTHPPTSSYLLNLRQNKNLPVLFPRNTISSRRDNNGLSQRSRATNNRSYKRYITRSNGDSEYNTGNGQDGTRTESDEENTVSTTRDGTSRIRFGNTIRRTRNYTRKSVKTHTSEDYNESTSKNENTVDSVGRNFDEFERENKLQIGRNETESAKLLPEHSRRLRGLVSEDKIGDISQSEEGNEKSDFDHAGNQRVADRNGPLTEENKGSYEGNETITSIEIPEISAKSQRKQGPVVVIIDGYSVTRNKNGENKLSEKTVHIHSQ